MIAAYRALLRMSWTRLGASLTAVIALLNLTANQGWVGGSASTAVAVTNAFGLAIPLNLASAGLDAARDRQPDRALDIRRAARPQAAINAVHYLASVTWVSGAYLAVVLAASIATLRASPGNWPSVPALAVGYLQVLAFVAVAMAIGRRVPVLVGLVVNTVVAYLAITFLAGEPETSPALFTIVDDTFGPPGTAFNSAVAWRQALWFLILGTAAGAALLPRATWRRVLTFSPLLVASAALLVTGPALRWVAPADSTALSDCTGSVCVWRDHLKSRPAIVNVIGTLTATRDSSLPIPSRWQESATPIAEAATIYLGSADASDRQVADGVAQGYLSWLVCHSPVDAPAAMAREQWLSARLVPDEAGLFPHVTEVNGWPQSRQWAWFAEIVPADCHPS